MATLTEVAEHEKLQSRFNLGMIGHVANGKSTLSRRITGTRTQRDSREMKEAGKTYNLSYANGVIYRCPRCSAPECYQSAGKYDPAQLCEICEYPVDFVRHLSIVDCPGHHDLMEKMLDGSSVMHGAVVLESVGNPEIPARQTIEHVMAAQAMGIPILMIVLNKVDTISQKKLKKKIEQLVEYFPDTPIVPCSANHGYNVDVILEYLSQVKLPEVSLESDALMYLIRSFGINTPGAPIQKLKGAVVGGSLPQGYLEIDDTVHFYPGRVESRPPDAEEGDGDTEYPNWVYRVLSSQVTSMMTEKTPLSRAYPGGLIAVGTELDPSLAAQNRMVGNLLMVSRGGALKPPGVYRAIKLEYRLSKMVPEGLDPEDYKLHKKDHVFINCNSANVEGQVVHLKKSKKMATIRMLTSPICAFLGQTVPISKPIPGSSRRLIGYATVVEGDPCLTLEEEAVKLAEAKARAELEEEEKTKKEAEKESGEEKESVEEVEMAVEVVVPLEAPVVEAEA